MLCAQRRQWDSPSPAVSCGAIPTTCLFEEPYTTMEDEIDLRAYIAVLLKFKFWIAGVALVAAVVAWS